MRDDLAEKEFRRRMGPYEVERALLIKGIIERARAEPGLPAVNVWEDWRSMRAHSYLASRYHPLTQSVQCHEPA